MSGPARTSSARVRAAFGVAMRVVGPVLRAIGRATAAALSALWRHREIVNAIFVRALWWGALVAWWSAAVPLVAGGELDVERALVVFAAGAAVCGLVVVLGRASRLRWWGGALGSVHGMCAVALWLVAAA